MRKSPSHLLSSLLFDDQDCAVVFAFLFLKTVTRALLCTATGARTPTITLVERMEECMYVKHAHILTFHKIMEQCVSYTENDTYQHTPHVILTRARHRF